MKRMYKLLTIGLLAISLVGCIGVYTTPVPEPPTIPARPATPARPAIPARSKLEAVLEVPATLPRGEEVNLRFTLINRTDTKLYVLKWYTPLEGIAGEIFLVERDGQAIPYQGILAMRATPSPEAYVLLKPGESVSAEVDLATAYDFSKTGEYAIKFLSPKISHIARAEAEMAKTLEDLGPVQIPSKRVSVTIAGSSGSSGRRTPAEAAGMIRDYLQSQKPDLNPDFRLPLEEVPMQEAWDYLRVQVFRVTEGVFIHESFLVSGDSVLPLGTAVGGHGLTSLEISDLDRDGSAELLFTYSFGSGIHQSRIGMYAPVHGKNQIYEAGTVYFGDLGLFKEDTSTVGVRVVESDEATLTLRYLDTLGYLSIERHNGQVELVLQLAEGLPDDVSRKLFDVIRKGKGVGK